jgi:hypothetical protein
MIYYFIFVVLLLIILWIGLLQLRKKNIEIVLEETGFTNYSSTIYNNQHEYTPANEEALKACQVPTLNSEQCYKSREYECPIVNGTYLQCTNNYIPKPSEYNADCGNRTFEMVPPPWKISENCYYDKIKFNREKTYKKVRFVDE